MTIKETLEAIINTIIVGGFLLLILGVCYWTYAFTQQYSLSTELKLIVISIILLVFGIIAAKLFSQVGS